MTRRKLVVPAQVHDQEGALVFAYGSNLREEQMRARCPSAKVVEVVRLSKHTLAFVGYSRTWGGAVATVVADAHDSVDGLLYRVSDADLRTLDAYEGAPHVYARAMCAVQGSKMRFRAWVYQHQNPIPDGPSYRYLAAIIEGRARLGLSSEPVVQAAERGLEAGPDAPPC